MIKHLIDCTAAELAGYTKAEFVSSLGTDIIMLNVFDVDYPVINGLPGVAPNDMIHEIKRLTGQMISINLEPAMISENGDADPVWNLTSGRRALAELKEAVGDSGYMGMALPENITAYSIAIRGRRHTCRRMACSLLREHF